jgi:hypothetical protein
MVTKINEFSTDFSVYDDWLKAHPERTPYNLRVVRTHERFPSASLTQLRGHASKGKRPVSKLIKSPIYKRSWSSLNERELRSREKSLEVLRKVKRGQSLTRASREFHTSAKTVLRNTNAFKKLNGKWIPKRHDRISRTMSIYEDGKQEWIEVRDSRMASRISKYNSAVKEFLETGNAKVLRPFRKPFRDAQGKTHRFETDPDKLYEIAEQQEEPEFWEIYKL